MLPSCSQPLQHSRMRKGRSPTTRPGSGASLKAFTALDADAWITWPNWPATKSDVLDEVPIAKDRQIWRDVSIAVAPEADQQARDFAAFLETPEAAELMKTEG